jgi:hypothetical protein
MNKEDFAIILDSGIDYDRDAGYLYLSCGHKVWNDSFTPRNSVPKFCSECGIKINPIYAKYMLPHICFCNNCPNRIQIKEYEEEPEPVQPHEHHIDVRSNY